MGLLGGIRAYCQVSAVDCQEIHFDATSCGSSYLAWAHMELAMLLEIHKQPIVLRYLSKSRWVSLNGPQGLLLPLGDYHHSHTYYWLFSSMGPYGAHHASANILVSTNLGWIPSTRLNSLLSIQCLLSFSRLYFSFLAWAHVELTMLLEIG